MHHPPAQSLQLLSHATSLIRWYVADYSKAAVNNWGLGAGCDFYSLPCAQYKAKNPTQEYFCNASGEDYPPGVLLTELVGVTVITWVLQQSHGCNNDVQEEHMGCSLTNVVCCSLLMLLSPLL